MVHQVQVNTLYECGLYLSSSWCGRGGQEARQAAGKLLIHSHLLLGGTSDLHTTTHSSGHMAELILHAYMCMYSICMNCRTTHIICTYQRIHTCTCIYMYMYMYIHVPVHDVHVYMTIHAPGRSLPRYRYDTCVNPSIALWNYYDVLKVLYDFSCTFIIVCTCVYLITGIGWNMSGGLGCSLPRELGSLVHALSSDSH